MATELQKDLISGNEKYASTFNEGHLALPPSKNYLVGEHLSSNYQSRTLLQFPQYTMTSLPTNPKNLNPSPFLYSHLQPVTCMDARIDPASAFSIPLGAAHVIRNAGASAQEALRSIIISQQLLGTDEILLIKHTGCGMLTFQNEDAYNVVEEGLGSNAARKLKDQHFDFLPFGDLEEQTKKEVEWLKNSEFVKKSGGDQKVSGWVYDVETGKVEKVA